VRKRAKPRNWITLQAPPALVQIAKQMARQDSASLSAFVRRLILEKAFERGLLPVDEAPMQADATPAKT
jgi:hypothetical protein